LALPGSIFLAAIQMVVVPLVFSSIILGLAEMGEKTQAKKLGLTAILFVLISTFLAAIVGVVVTQLLHPGEYIRDFVPLVSHFDVSKTDSFVFTPQTVLNFIPINPLQALMRGDLLEVLIIAIIFGVVMSQIESKQIIALKQFLTGIQTLCLQVITLAMSIAPYAVFGLMLRAFVHSGMSVLAGMLGYIVCVFLGFIVMAIFYALWIWIVLKKNAIKFFSNSKEALLLAFSLSSSAATMPTTLRVATKHLHIEEEISGLLIPLGTTINMAGSAIWQTSATLFLAQAFGSDVSLLSILLVVALSVGASIGTPGVPGAGLGVLTTTLKSVGVPATGIPLILGVDRLVDMGCTVVNVMGDLVMCLTAQWILKKNKNST